MHPTDAMSLRRRIAREESGMTLIEVVVSLSIGLIVLMAGFMLLDRATVASTEIADRQEAVQTGRQAMELMTRALRSQVCLGESAEPISYGDGGTVTFYSDLSDGSKNIERRTLAYEPPAGGSPGRLVETVEPGVGTYPDLEFGASSTTRELLASAGQVTAGGVTEPVFSYFAYQAGSPTGDMDELTTPLSASDASRTVMVRIEFVAMPDRVDPDGRNDTTFQDNVYVRIADPTRPLEGPRCI